MRQTSPGILSVKECPFYIYQTSDFSHCSPQYIPVNNQTTSDRLTANCGPVGIPCNLWLCAAGFSLNRMCKLAVTDFILTCRYQYIPQNFPLLFVIIFLTFSTTASHGSTSTSARCDWIRIKPNDRRFIQCATS